MRWVVLTLPNTVFTSTSSPEWPINNASYRNNDKDDDDDDDNSNSGSSSNNTLDSDDDNNTNIVIKQKQLEDQGSKKDNQSLTDDSVR